MPITIEEDRAVTMYVKNRDVIELIEALELDNSRSASIWDFFQNPVKWEYTKKYLQNKINRVQ